MESPPRARIKSLVYRKCLVYSKQQHRRVKFCRGRAGQIRVPRILYAAGRTNHPVTHRYETSEMEGTPRARYVYLVYTKQQHVRESGRNGQGHCCAHAPGYGDHISPSGPATTPTDKVPLCLVYSEQQQHARGSSRHGQSLSSTQSERVLV